MVQMVIHAQNVKVFTRTRKGYEDTKENSMEMMYVISHFFCVESAVYELLTYVMKTWSEKFFIIYILWYCVIGGWK